MQKHAMEYIDPIWALQAAARTEALYPSDVDSHLNIRGNEVMAVEVLKSLSNNRPSQIQLGKS